MTPGPSIADLLEETSRQLAGTDARVYRRVADHLQRSSASLDALQDLVPSGPRPSANILLGKGSFLQQPVTTLRRLCKEQGLKGTSKLKKPDLAALLEQHGVTPPPPPLESFTKKELIAMVRQLLQAG